jgi:hypothetical protein
MSVPWWITPVLNSVISFTLLVFTIPLAFDVGGRDCGLVPPPNLPLFLRKLMRWWQTYSLAVAIFYFCLCSLRLGLRHSRHRWLPSLIGIFQNVIVPIILISVLNEFATTSTAPNLVHRLLLRPWDWMLTKSTPAFTLIEGFASLLVIQAAGQICRWVVNNRSDTWMVWPQFFLSLSPLALRRDFLLGFFLDRS